MKVSNRKNPATFRLGLGKTEEELDKIIETL